MSRSSRHHKSGPPPAVSAEPSEKEFRSEGRRLVWRLWRYASLHEREDEWPDVRFQLGNEATREIGELLVRAWHLFDAAEVTAVTPEIRAAHAAKVDKEFQRFMVSQGLRGSHRSPSGRGGV